MPILKAPKRRPSAAAFHPLPPKFPRNVFLVSLLLLLSVYITGCGGPGDTGDPPPTTGDVVCTIPVVVGCQLTTVFIDETGSTDYVSQSCGGVVAQTIVEIVCQ